MQTGAEKVSKSKLWGKPISISSSAARAGFSTQHSKKGSRTLLVSTKGSKNDDGFESGYNLRKGRVCTDLGSV